MVRGFAECGDLMCKEIFRAQARALSLFFDEMVNTFDPAALIVGGGAIETNEEFQAFVPGEIAPACRASEMNGTFRSTSCRTATPRATIEKALFSNIPDASRSAAAQARPM
jgi:predicted NBD/HSP70 family sugar kinase